MWTIDEFFGVDGLLARHLDDYEPRPSQVEYAKQCDYAISHQKHLIAEGPTGLGKGHGYLSCCIRHCVENRKIACIATANIALQEQLINKDLPLLREASGRSFSFALAKGRNNYLCIRKLKDFEREHLMFERKFERNNYSFEGDINEILEWAERTKTGDRSELSVEPSSQNWAEFSVSSEDCLGKECSFKERCYTNLAKLKLKTSHIIVVNYHLLFAHLDLKVRTDGVDIILPPIDILVCDEGHEMADIARGWFGWSVSEASIELLLKQFSQCRGKVLKIIKETLEKKRPNLVITQEDLRGMSEIATKVETSTKELFDRGRALYKEQGEKRKNSVLHKPGILDTDALQYNLSLLGASFKKLSKMFVGDFCAEVSKSGNRSLVLGQYLEELSKITDQNSAYFVELRGKRRRLSFVKRKIIVSDILEKWLFESIPSVIVTSATLRTGEGFNFIQEEIGLYNPLEFVGKTPFDYYRQCLLVTPLESPDPSVPGSETRMCELLLQAIQQASGRTLGLFTSYEKMYLAKKYLTERLEGYEVFCQGDSPRSQLVKKFQKNISSVLLGTDSFWTGIDVPGEACSCVVIDRLPFPSPADPIIEALTHRANQANKSGWRLVSLPRAILKLRQGVGRLVRKSTDRGVVVILDKRINEKGYGVSFIRSLPRMYRSDTLQCNAIPEFLGKI